MKIGIVIDEKGNLVGACSTEPTVIGALTITPSIRQVDQKHTLHELEVEDNFFKSDEEFIRKQIQSKIGNKH